MRISRSMTLYSWLLIKWSELNNWCFNSLNCVGLSRRSRRNKLKTNSVVTLNWYWVNLGFDNVMYMIDQLSYTVQQMGYIWWDYIKKKNNHVFSGHYVCQHLFVQINENLFLVSGHLFLKNNPCQPSLQQVPAWLLFPRKLGTIILFILLIIE